MGLDAVFTHKLLPCVEMRRILQASTFDGIISKFRDSSVASALFAETPHCTLVEGNVFVCSLLIMSLGVLQACGSSKMTTKRTKSSSTSTTRPVRKCHRRWPNTDPGLSGRR